MAYRRSVDGRIRALIKLMQPRALPQTLHFALPPLRINFTRVYVG